MLNKYGMDECKAVPTTISHGKLLYKDDRTPKAEVITYRSLVGCFMFLTNTRPNIIHVILIF